MKKIYSLLLGLLLVASFYAVDKPVIQIAGRVTHGEEKLQGVSVKIYSEDYKVILQQRETSASGKYDEIEIEMGEVYIMEVSKKGYVPKRILIDSKNNYIEEDSPMYIPMDIPFQLHENRELKKRKVLRARSFFIGKLSIDPATGGLAIDASVTSQGKSEYESHLKK